MVTGFQHLGIGKTGGIKSIDTTHILIFIIQLIENIIQIIIGINTMVGAFKNKKIKLLQTMIQIHILKLHIIIIMTLKNKRIIGKE